MTTAGGCCGVQDEPALRLCAGLQARLRISGFVSIAAVRARRQL